eukprot:XP_011612930.1 PREDICTED: uncharacterized protein LOC105417915 [Takifugu rubripes]
MNEAHDLAHVLLREAQPVEKIGMASVCAEARPDRLRNYGPAKRDSYSRLVETLSSDLGYVAGLQALYSCHPSITSPVPITPLPCQTLCLVSLTRISAVLLFPVSQVLTYHLVILFLLPVSSSPGPEPLSDVTQSSATEVLNCFRCFDGLHGSVLTDSAANRRFNQTTGEQAPCAVALCHQTDLVVFPVLSEEVMKRGRAGSLGSPVGFVHAGMKWCFVVSFSYLCQDTRSAEVIAKTILTWKSWNTAEILNNDF